MEREVEIRSRTERPHLAASTFEAKFAALESRLVQLGAGQWHRAPDLGQEMRSRNFQEIACRQGYGAKRTPMPEDMNLAHAAPGLYMKTEEFNHRGRLAWLVAFKQ